MGSITDELRECIATAIWQYENDTKTAYIPKDKLTAIADRIDARYKRDMATAQQVGYNEGEDAAMRDGWVKLPTDADGVPIKVGDVVVEHRDGYDNPPYRVERIALFSDGSWEIGGCGMIPHMLTHYQPDSWERIEADMQELERKAKNSGFDSRDAFYKELRGLLGRCRGLAE